MSPNRVLLALPAYNEAAHLEAVCEQIQSVRRARHFDVLVVDDGSTDDTAALADAYGFRVLKHSGNLGYGASLRSAFRFAVQGRYQYIITMDADGQHFPELLPVFIDHPDAGVVSGSRYLPGSPRLTVPPVPEINHFFRDLVRMAIGVEVSDVGCGMKRICVGFLSRMLFRETGYAFPLEFWSKVRMSGASVCEVPVPLVYLDRSRSMQARLGSLEAAVDYGLFVLLANVVGAPVEYDSLAWRGLSNFLPRDFLKGHGTVCHVRDYLAQAVERGFPGLTALANLECLMLHGGRGTRHGN